MTTAAAMAPSPTLDDDDPKAACHACKQKMIDCNGGCLDVKAAKMKDWCKEVCSDETIRCHDVCDDLEADKTDKAWRARCSTGAPPTIGTASPTRAPRPRTSASTRR